jgi:hypothetical protein
MYLPTATPTKALLRVPFGTRPRGNPMPDRFELSLRTGKEQQRVRWDRQRLMFDCIRASGSDSAAFRPSLREWERFWQTVDRLGVWRWADGFGNATHANEPTWSLDLARSDLRLQTSGFRAYPPLAEGPEMTPVFASFCAAVSRLVGDQLAP